MSDEKERIDGILEKKKSEDVPVGIGERIAYLRRRQGMTQAQLAEQLGISGQAVSKWESGLSCPDIMILMPLAKIFNVTADALLSGDGLPRETAADWAAEPKAEEPEAEEPEAEEPERPLYQTKAMKEKIVSLDAELGVAEVFIRTGTEFSLELIGYGADECDSVVENGRWRIRDRWRAVWFSGLRNMFLGRKAIITVPEGYRFGEVRLSIGAGTLTGEGLIADRCVLNVGAGQMTLLDFHSGPATIECGMGEVKLTGSLRGKCKMDCGMGSITANLKALEKLGYDLSMGMGEIKFGEDRFSGFGGEQRKNGDAENFFKISVGMGSVAVRFTQK